ncbi:MAG: hypothetical protein K6G60_05075 [Lachnospiraceae bacterium]|nr:hypothetical protein [Lachnospiraceae bacterium]
MIKVDMRDKRLLYNIVGAFAVKGLGLLINFFTVPLYMKYFENEGILGVWYTILSILTWVLTFDLGIGNGLRNHLVEPIVKKNSKDIKIYLSSAYASLGCVSVVILAVGLIVVNVLNWNSIFKVSSEIIPLSALRLAFGISIAGLAIQFFLKLILSVLNAMEKTAISNAIMLFSNVINFLFLYVGYSGGDIDRLITLSVVYACAVNIPLVITTVVLFAGRFRDSLPSLSDYNKAYAGRVLGLGGSFFAIQILFMIITSTNEFFISNVFGADNVVEFQVYNKVFYTFVTLFSLITNPIWSAVTRAWKEKRFKWIRKSFYMMLGTAALGVIGVVILSLIFQPVVDIWLRDEAIVTEGKYIFAFAVYVSIMFFVFAVNGIANGIQSLKPQVVWFSVSVFVKCAICVFFKGYIESWDVIIWINSITLVPYVIFQIVDLSRRLDILEKEIKKN